MFLVHFAQKFPRRFLKPAVCKHPTTVNKSEIHIFVAKALLFNVTSCVRWNRVRNDCDRRPETRRMRSLVALLKIPMDSVQRLGVAKTACRVGSCHIEGHGFGKKMCILRIIHSCWIFAHGWFKKKTAEEHFCAKCSLTYSRIYTFSVFFFFRECVP